MVRRFFKDSAVYALASLTARGMALILIPYYVRALTQEEMGALDLLLAWSAFAAVVTGLEIAIGMARDYSDQKDATARTEVVSSALWFSAGVYTAFFVAVAAASRPLAGALLGDRAQAPAVIAAAAALAAGGIFLVVAQQLRYLMKPGLFAVTSLINAGAALLATLFFVSWLRLGVIGVFLGTLTGILIALVPAWRFTRGSFSRTFSRSRCASLLRFSLPLVPSSIAVVVNLHLSRLAIDHFLTRDAVGVYGVAARIGSMINLIMAGFSGAMAPLVFSRHSETETPRDLARIFRIFMVAALLGTSGFVLFAPEVLGILATPAYSGALPAIRILVPAALLAQMYVFAPGAWIKKRTWWITAGNVTAAGINVLLNWVLIPRVGLEGAAWAGLGSAVVSFGISMSVSQHFYPVPHHWRQITAAVCGTAGLIACGMFFGGNAAWSGMLIRILAMAAVLLWIRQMLGLRLRLR